MEPDSGELKDGWDSIRLDLFSSQVTRSLKMLDVDDSASHPSLLSGSTGNVTISWVGKGDILYR